MCFLAYLLILTVFQCLVQNTMFWVYPDKYKNALLYMLPKYSKRIFLVMLSMLAYAVLSQEPWLNRMIGFIAFFVK